jgi:hypothetical protein
MPKNRRNLMAAAMTIKTGIWRPLRENNRHRQSVGPAKSSVLKQLRATRHWIVIGDCRQCHLTAPQTVPRHSHGCEVPDRAPRHNPTAHEGTGSSTGPSPGTGLTGFIIA